MTNSKGKGRQQLLMLMAFFASPIVVAIIMYNIAMNEGPSKTKNHGELITPARPLQDVSLLSDNSKPYKFSDMKGKWIMVYIGENSCNEDCANVLYKMRQSRLAQQGEHKRIKRLYISINGKADVTLKKVIKDHPGLEVVSGSKADIEKVIKQFQIENKTGPVTAKRLYLVDPLGNLMMSYEKDFDAKGLIKDLTVLLKISRIG